MNYQMNFSNYITTNSKYNTVAKITKADYLYADSYKLLDEINNIRELMLNISNITVIDKLELQFLKDKKKELSSEYKNIRKCAKKAELEAYVAYCNDLNDYHNNDGQYYTLIKSSFH
jgi:hypothetical protein